MNTPGMLIGMIVVPFCAFTLVSYNVSYTDKKVGTKSGLRENSSYKELSDYVEKDAHNIKLPGRRAKFFRNGFSLSRLPGTMPIQNS